MTCRRTLRAARTAALHPPTAAALARLGVDLEALSATPALEAEDQAPKPRPVHNAHSDGPDDAHPYRRDYRTFERDRS